MLKQLPSTSQAPGRGRQCNALECSDRRLRRVPERETGRSHNQHPATPGIPIFSLEPTPDSYCDRRWRGRLGSTASAGRWIIAEYSRKDLPRGTRSLTTGFAWDRAEQKELHYWEAGTIENRNGPFPQRQTSSALGARDCCPTRLGPWKVCARPVRGALTCRMGLRRGRVRGW